MRTELTSLITKSSNSLAIRHDFLCTLVEEYISTCKYLLYIPVDHKLK